MIFINQSHKIIDEIDGQQILKKIEYCARTCYNSHDKAGDGTAEKLIRTLIKSGHESVLEHVSITVELVTDRAVLAELTRHRLASFSVQSQRYVTYKDNVKFISGEFLARLAHEENKAEFDENAAKAKKIIYGCFDSMYAAEKFYLTATNEYGIPAQLARCVLGNSTATVIVMTCNLREWRHVFKLRADPAAHPDMVALMTPLLQEFKEKIPVIFDDIEVKCPAPMDIF